MNSSEQAWRIFVENRAAVIAALERGEVDGILPAARGFLDGFAEFLLENQVLQTLAEFKDSRARRSLPLVFFCTGLVDKPLFQLRSLGQIGSVLFRWPYILRQLGFNARPLEQGFYQTPEAQRPFDPEAITECFADVKAAALFKHQQQMLKVFAQRFPAQLRDGLWVMDSVPFHIPRGNHTPAAQFKACVLGVYQGSVVWPMLWQCVASEMAEVTVGQTVLAAALKVLPKGVMRHLLIDRGYLDGDWLSRLYRRHEVQVTIGVRANMQAYHELIGLTRLPQTGWEAVPPPDNHREPAPERAVSSIETVTSWERCPVPLAGGVIRDTYPDQVSYQVLVMTLPRQASGRLTAKDSYRGRAQRWTLEEVFMALTRYRHFDALYPCRLGVGRAIAHFSLPAFTLLGLYRQESDAAETRPALNAGPPPLPLPERELAVYAGPYFALLRTSHLIDLSLQHAEVWTNRRADIFQALSRFEGDP